MLTIDDPEVERLIREEAARTGEAPEDVLRRALRRAAAFGAPDPLTSDDDISSEPVVMRNGLRLFPRRPDEPPITPELVKRLLEESE
jgi:hypothetical protein